MSVYPDDSKPTPKGALVPSGVKALQSVTEESARDQIRSQALVPWQEARGNFFTNIIGGIGKAFEAGLRGIVDGLSSIFDPVRRAGEAAKDGQVDLNDRLDLLSPLLDYCSVSAPPGKGDAMNGKGLFPFNYQIGPARGATPVDNMIRLEDKGLWDIRCMLTINEMMFDGYYQVNVRVLHPDGKTVYSEQSAHCWALTSGTETIVTSVVVPEPGYIVGCWVYAAGFRGYKRGPRWSRLTVQHISRNIDAGTGAEESSPGGAPSPEVVEEERTRLV